MENLKLTHSKVDGFWLLVKAPDGTKAGVHIDSPLTNSIRNTLLAVSEIKDELKIEDHICACDGSCINKIEKIKTRLDNIKALCGYLHGFHPPTCNGWNTFNKKIIFENYNCDCFIDDIIHELEMADGELND